MGTQPGGATPPAATAAVTSDEQTLAFLAHILQLFTWWIGPLVIFLAKRDSRFVSFHALQALLWQVAWSLAGIVLGVLFVVGMFASVAMRAGAGSSHAPPLLFMVLFPLLWLLIAGGWVVTLVFAIVYGIKSMRGEWAEYPLFGGWARRIAGV